MPRAYLVDLREGVVGAHTARTLIPEIARRFAVRPASVYRWVRRVAAGDSLAPQQGGDGPAS